MKVQTQGECPTSGTLVARKLFMTRPSAARLDQLQRAAAESPEVISFAGGLPDPQLFPKYELSDAFYCALHGSQSLQYGWPEGEPELREWVAARLRSRGADVDAEHVLITSGAQQAISVAARSLLSAGDRVGVKSPTYPGALEIFRGLELDLVDGSSPARAYYVQSAIENPRGSPLGEAERHELLKSAEGADAVIIEDDAYAETVFAGRPARPLLADAPETVLHIGTLSKILCPGLRIGWLVTRHPKFAELLREKQQTDLQAAPLTQRIVIEYLRGGHLEPHLARIRREYARKAERLCRAVRLLLPEFSVTEPQGGFSLWLEAREGAVQVSDLDWLASAVRHGVSFDPGRSFRAQRSDRLSLRLCYSGAPEEAIERGVRRLGEALRALGAQQAWGQRSAL